MMEKPVNSAAPQIQSVGTILGIRPAPIFCLTPSGINSRRLLQSGNDLSALYNTLLNSKLYIEYQAPACGFLPWNRNPGLAELQSFFAS